MVFWLLGKAGWPELQLQDKMAKILLLADTASVPID